MRKFLLLLPLFVLIGCSGGKTGKNLTIWESYNDEEHAVFMEIVKAFEESTGIKVQVQRIPFFGMESKILTALATGSEPDIARVDLAMVAKLATRGAVKNIGNFDTSELLPVALKSVEIDGKLYGIPDQVNCLALFYNKKLFKEKGIKPPDTWEEFVKAGKKLTDKKKNIYGFAMRNTLWWHLPFFYGFGARLMKDGRFTLDTPEAVEALKFIKKLYDNGIEAGAWKPGAVDPDMGFQNGKYAMVFNGPWKIKSLKGANIPFGIVPVPRGKYGRPTPIGGTDMVIFKRSKHTEESLKFLQFLVSENIQTLWANKLGQLPVNVKSMENIDYERHPYIKIFAEAIKEAVPRPIIPDYQGVENIVNPEIESALFGKKTPEKALKDATRRVNEEIFGIK